jgi:hypothetical protein
MDTRGDSTVGQGLKTGAGIDGSGLRIADLIDTVALPRGGSCQTQSPARSAGAFGWRDDPELVATKTDC